MTSFVKTALIALVIASGATAVSADPLLKELASKGSIVTVNGIAGTN